MSRESGDSSICFLGEVPTLVWVVWETKKAAEAQFAGSDSYFERNPNGHGSDSEIVIRSPPLVAGKPKGHPCHFSEMDHSFEKLGVFCHILACLWSTWLDNMGVPF